ncbi:hypothetical protein M2138_001899 [Dysgonomonadaceae bacterium PH5-43]|nr:hypothetical protein [Dysgonomonadaceae bacterium PH5-43]
MYLTYFTNFGSNVAILHITAKVLFLFFNINPSSYSKTAFYNPLFTSITYALLNLFKNSRIIQKKTTFSGYKSFKVA